MGLVLAPIKLSNARDPSLVGMEVPALVDTGALLICIPEHIAIQLKLVTLEQREVTTADGKRQVVQYVGPLQVHFENRSCYAGALVLGNQVLLGVVPMEDMDLVVCPKERKLKVNPDSPNMASNLVK